MTPPERSDAVEDYCAAAYVAVMASLPGMGPATLVRLLTEHSPAGAWEEIRTGRVRRPTRAGPGGSPDVGAADPRERLFAPGPPNRIRPKVAWADMAARIDPLAAWSKPSGAGMRVTWWGRDDYPPALVGDPQPPGALFWRGGLQALDAPCVAIVGTRSATPDGRAIAYEMGRDLTAAGVTVISGLALGIDGAAHLGALAAADQGAAGRPVGVVASGADQPYPLRHRDLWERVAAAGAIVSETAPGRPPQAWRFPARNRIIAGLARLVVVVESHARGGSLITAEAAIERGIEVRVVPGPVRSPSCAGSNQLLYDGPGPVRNAKDVLDALGQIRPDRSPGTDPAPSLTGAPAVVMAALGHRPASVGQVMERTGFEAGKVHRHLEELAALGLVAEQRGWWART